MSEIRPLCGVRYNGAKIPDCAAVICPPYDVISPAGQRALYERSPYNFVRIEYGETQPQDTEANNRYTRAAACFKEWRDSGVLIEDPLPAIYVHDHYFTYQGREYRRRGLACRVRLEEWERMIVRPHEHIIAAHKGDRIRLIGALGANTSPVLAMYRDDSGEIGHALAKAADGRPVAQSSLMDGERHELFAINDPREIACLERAFAALPLYIADGHHRYESALAYRREQSALHPEASAETPFNYVLMTLIDMDDPELLILPPHRLLRGLSQDKLAELENRLGAFFDVEIAVPEAPEVWQRIEELQGRTDELRLVLAGPGNLIRALKLREFEDAACLMPVERTDIYRKLDVSLVDHIILEHILELKSDDATAVAFSYDRTETTDKVVNGDYQLAFIVKPVRPEIIMNIADARDRMPRKSTYFYPKLPSGLLVNRVV